jgi:ABC-type microcin C transport system permease subunit YejE
MSIVRRAVIFVAHLALLFIVVATMAGALAGDAWVANAAPMFGGIVALMPSASISIAGAIAGFFISILLTALFFVLVEIAHNTRNPFGP